MIFKTKSFKKLVYQTIGRLRIRTEHLDDVLILTSSRSGSTWLNESLQKTREFKLYNQPFDKTYNMAVYDDLLPCDKNNPFFSNLDQVDHYKLLNYWKLMIDGKIYPNTTWRIFSKEFNFFYKRKLIKSFFTKDFIEFYSSQPSLKIIYLIRNPIKRAISNINYGYNDLGSHLLKNRILIKSAKINTDKLSHLYETTESLITKHVISWYLENFIIYDFLNRKHTDNIIIVKYEDLVSNSETESDISQFIFNNSTFKMSKKASKTTQSNPAKNSNLAVNNKEMLTIKSCFPEYLPYLDELLKFC